MTSHRAKPSPRRWWRLLAGLGTLAALAGLLIGLSQAHGERAHLAEAPAQTTGPATPQGAADPARQAEVVAQSQVAPRTTPHPPAPHTSSTKPAPPSPCRTSTAAQHVIVSISQQHAWMCNGARQVYSSAVTTGASALGYDTPTGTWQVQSKQTDRWLTVNDGGSYYVKYWMPYDGSYGFHDSSWQTFAYGSPQYRTSGSHGCVHLPNAAMIWTYNWAQVGTLVTVQA